MNKLLKKLLKNWVLKNYPFEETTKKNVFNEYFETVLIKKGRIKELRTYKDGKRIKTVKL